MVKRGRAGFLAFALVAGVVLAVGLPGPASAAQATPDSCGQQGLTLSRVDVTSPKPGASVTAGPQKVSGRVGTGFTRVELFVDDQLRDSKELGPTGGTFDLSWQATVTPARSATLLVVACGAGIASLVRASTELTVSVTPAPTTTRPPASTTVVTQSPTSTPATTSTAATATTTAAAAAAAEPATTAGSGTTAPARVPQAAAAAVARTTTTRPRPATPPLVLSEQQGDDSNGPPLWVGAVVGLGGIIGLVMSAVFSRRSAARAARSELPPVDPADERSDLVSL